jgi:anthranilate/para-aminobenzoate synthase component I
VGTGALVRATFPPASVTGAPKPRVLQAIEDLEPVSRGVYCGAVGWIGELHQPPPMQQAAALELNVAIRTFQILDGRTHLGVGGGITADSDPAAEWRETELKAARLLAVAGAPEGAVAGGRMGVPA